MKQPNKKIGVLDLNTDNIYVLNSIRNKFINDDIYYVNGLNIDNIDEMDVEELKRSVSKSIEYLLSKNVDVLLVASDSVIEFCEDNISFSCKSELVQSFFAATNKKHMCIGIKFENAQDILFLCDKMDEAEKIFLSKNDEHSSLF